MNLLSLPPLASSLLFLLLGVFIFLNNKKSKVNFIFFLVCLSTAWWQLSWFILFNTSDEKLASILVKIGYAGIILIPVLFFHFFILFLHSIKRFDRLFLYCLYFSVFIFELVLFFSDFFVDGYYRFYWGFYPSVGAAHPLYLILLFLVAIRIIYLLFRSLKQNKSLSSKEQKLKHDQAKYLLLSFIFYVLSSSDFIVNYGFEFYPLGFVFVTIFSLLIAYSITKVQILDAKAITTEIFAVYLALIMFIEIFSAGSSLDFLFRSIVFLITLIFSALLIRSVLREVKKREEMEKLNLKLNKMTRQLASANKELKRLDDAKSEFLSISSHQLRTPLTIIKGYSSMLLEGNFGKMPIKVKDSVNKIYISTERLIMLVEDLLNISRIEAGRIEFKIEAVDIDAVTKSLVNDFLPKAAEKNLKLEFHPEPNIPKVAADPQKIKDIISNLIDNAIKYTQKGEIIINLHQESQSVVFCSQDTGMGIEPDELNRLFNKFTRGKDSGRVNTEGTGLGLYFARMVTENMGGRIWAESPGKGMGSKFCFSLPMFDKKQAKKIS